MNDAVLSIVTGLGMRLLLGGLEEDLGRISPMLLGLWEGAVVHHFSINTLSFDHYLAYGLRMAIDVLFTGNLSRMVVVLLWTGFGMVASKVVSPISGREGKHGQKHKTVRPILSRTRAYPIYSKLQAPHDTPKRIPPILSSQPLGMAEPSRPESPSLPRFFPHGAPVQLQSDSVGRVPEAPPSLIPVPTPPVISVLDNELSDLSYAQLSTIQEISGAEGIGPTGANPNVDRSSLLDSESYAGPSASFVPSTVKSPNLLYGEDGNGDGIYAPSIVTSVALPMPNAGIRDGQMNKKPAMLNKPNGLLTPNATVETISVPAEFSPIDGSANANHISFHAFTLPPNVFVKTQIKTDAGGVISTQELGRLRSEAKHFRDQAEKEKRYSDRFRQEHKEALKGTEVKVKEALFMQTNIRDSEARAEKLHKEAATRYFIANNSSQNEGTISLNDLRADEAIEVIENTLRQAVIDRRRDIKFIVGGGIKSILVKNEITNKMDRQKIPWSQDRYNSGILIFPLSPS